MSRAAVLLVQVVLLFPRKVKDLIAFAMNIVKMMTNNPNFPSPTPTLAAITALAAKLQVSDNAATARVPGAVGQRNADKVALKRGLTQLRDHVQGVIDPMARADALAAVEGTGMKVKKHTVPDKPAIAVKDGPVSGAVQIEVKVLAAWAAYYWQFSLDGQSWQSAPETAQAHTVIGGLTVGHTYFFRFRTLTRKGMTDTSDPRVALVPASTPNARGELPPSTISAVGRASETVKSVWVTARTWRSWSRLNSWKRARWYSGRSSTLARSLSRYWRTRSTVNFRGAGGAWALSAATSASTV